MLAIARNPRATTELYRHAALASLTSNSSVSAPAFAPPTTIRLPSKLPAEYDYFNDTLRHHHRFGHRRSRATDTPPTSFEPQSASFSDATAPP